MIKEQDMPMTNTKNETGIATILTQIEHIKASITKHENTLDSLSQLVDMLPRQLTSAQETAFCNIATIVLNS